MVRRQRESFKINKSKQFLIVWQLVLTVNGGCSKEKEGEDLNHHGYDL
jgi:hypothetical protein